VFPQFPRLPPDLKNTESDLTTINGHVREEV
jgi:hypothetical protein